MKNSSKTYKALRMTLHITLMLLVVEFVLGMYTALFVQFPDTLTSGNAWSWSFSQSPIILAHIIFGTLLFVAALAALGLSFPVRNKAGIITAGLGFVLVLVAYMSGSIFLTNVENDAYSFTMALGFMGAFISYGVGYYLTRPADENSVR
jgi:hypothetical protein